MEEEKEIIVESFNGKKTLIVFKSGLSVELKKSTMFSTHYKGKVTYSFYTDISRRELLSFHLKSEKIVGLFHTNYKAATNTIKSTATCSSDDVLANTGDYVICFPTGLAIHLEDVYFKLHISLNEIIFYDKSNQSISYSIGNNEIDGIFKVK